MAIRLGSKRRWHLDQSGIMGRPVFRIEPKKDSHTQHHQRNNGIENNRFFIHLNTFLAYGWAMRIFYLGHSSP
jgi:hypothetical protein